MQAEAVAVWDYCTAHRVVAEGASTEAETEAESAAVVAATAAMAAGCTPFVTNERLVMNGCPDGEGFERGAAGSSAREAVRYAGASRIEASFRRLSSHRRPDSGAARRLCAGATSRLEAAVSCLLSPSPPVQRRGGQLRAGQRRG